MSAHLKFHHKIHSYVVPLCQPNGTSPTETSQGLFINSLNFYTLLAFQLSNFLTFAFHSSYTWRLFLLYSGLLAFMMVSLLLTCRSHPKIYKFTNSIILTLAGPATVYTSEHNLFFGMTISFIAPSIILLILQAKLWAYLSFILEYIFLNLVYLPVYQKFLVSALLKDPEHMTSQHFNAFNFIYIFNALMLYATYSMKGSSPSQSSGQSKAQSPLVLKFVANAETFLNQVVNNINIALLEENYARAKTYISKAKVYGDVLLCKARNILDVEKKDSSAPGSDIAYTRVTDLLEKIWLTSSEIIKRKGLFGTITLHREIPPVLMLDQNRLMQVILSVTANAVKFTERGDINLSFNWVDREAITDSVFEPIPYDEGEGIGEGGGIGQARTSTLRRGYRSNIEGESFNFDINERRLSSGNAINLQQIAGRKGILKIIITNPGSGIPPGEAHELLTVFSKDPQSRGGQGSKISNMWAIDKICQKMNGRARFYSRPGEGVTCVICVKTEVPSGEIMEQNPLRDEEAIAPSQRKIKGILYDDSPYSPDTIKGYLEKVQVDVLHVVKNADELLDAYERELRQRRTVEIITINTQAALSEIKNLHERVRYFETSKRIDACNILLLSETHTESELKGVIKEAENAKENQFMRSPIYFPELQKIISSMNSGNANDIRENFHPKKIFIVNDNTFTIDLLARMLSMNGFENIQALNGELAVEKYRQEWKDIAVIFMDCQMPVMNGYDATKQIRKFQQMNKIPRIKILAVSGNAGPEHDEECREAGMDATVMMPFSADQIKRIATESVGQYQ